MVDRAPGLPLRQGSAGETVRDLQRRLTEAGYAVVGDTSGEFATGTTRALKEFQSNRGLVNDGICGSDSWSAIVEAGFDLGDRLLYLRRPMVRGDDVAELQHKLGSLGFDSGRVDGIFGPLTETALKDFQRNSAITTDGVCGPDVIRSLTRLGAMARTNEVVAGVRDRLNVAPRDLAGRRVAIGHDGALDIVVRSVARLLTDQSAIVAVLPHPESARQVEEANAFGADVYLNLCPSPDDGCRAAFYSTTGFESSGGHRLADALAEELSDVLTIPMDVVGMRLPVLRETRMPAVVCHLTPTDVLVRRGPAVAQATTQAIARWSADPIVAISD